MSRSCLRMAMCATKGTLDALASTVRSDGDRAVLRAEVERIDTALRRDAEQDRTPTPYLPNPARFAEPSAMEDKQPLQQQESRP